MFNYYAYEKLIKKKEDEINQKEKDQKKDIDKRGKQNIV